MRISMPEGGWEFKRVTTHPGVILEEEFLKPLKMSRNQLALDLHVPATRIGEIIHGRRAVSPDTALRLGRYFRTTPEFWLNLQQSYDLSTARVQSMAKILAEVRELQTA